MGRRKTTIGLGQALDYLRTHQLPLTQDATLWAPNTPVPDSVRVATNAYRRELAALIEQSDHRVCCSPALHRREWRFAGQQIYRCGICERLAPEMVRRAG